MILKKLEKKTENFRAKCSHYSLDDKENLIYIEKYLNNINEYIIPTEIEKNNLKKNSLIIGSCLF